MKNKDFFIVKYRAMLVIALCCFGLMQCSPETASVSEVQFEGITLPGATVLAFGPNNELFIGDSRSSKVYALKTEANPLKDPVPYNYMDFDMMLANALNIEPRDVVITDMKVHPISQEAYIAVKRGHQPDAPALIAIANPMNSEIRFLNVKNAMLGEVSVMNPASDDLTFWREIPANSLTITDIDYHNGHLYVAGLSNGEFASTMRKIAYPFDGTQHSVKSIEIYHAVHIQNETRAPIRTMLFDEIEGKSTLIASYTCTPLVTIPTAEITNNSDVKGKTIAELGYGNAPIDMINVMTQAPDGSFIKQLLITHKNRGGTLIPYDAIIAGAKGKGMAGMRAQAPTGLDNMVSIPTASIMQIDNQNQMMVTVLRRNMDNGRIELVSQLTGVFLRLSDFIAEYDFPDYEYGEGQEFVQKFHEMIKPLEGYPELASKGAQK